MKVLKEFTSYLDSCLSYTSLHDRKPKELRVSGFPYCGLRHYYELLRPKQEVLSFDSSYYCNVGTLTHSLLQKYMSKGRILGNWICKKCKYKRKLSVDCICPKCKVLMHYVEIELKYKQISGHTDGIYLSKSKKYYLIDYKGSSTRHIDNHQKFKNVFPHHNNVIQIKSYCALVEHLLGINIDGWILIYTARDNPKYSKVIVGEEISKETKRKILRQIDKYDKQYTLVTNCKTWYDVKELVDCKPCKTSEIYYKHYHGYTGCTLGVSGLCFSRKELLQHLKIVRKV